ncbi:MAG: Flp pilus assembly complex ATPase component TadA [Planctomycetes bacterium]|nr:Flp pilus assembly complex ATPase component TadA [Planctomycetota bacterium]
MSEALKPTILCVDDDADIREWLEAVLSARGWDVMNVGGGRMALEVARKQPPDVILLDVTMPDLNGYEVCARLQEHESTSKIPVIFATALDGEQDKIRAFQAGAADYLVKPIQENTLFQIVDLHLLTSRRWRELSAPAPEKPAETKVETTTGAARWNARLKPTEFTRFKEYLGARLNLPPDVRNALGRLNSRELYSQAAGLKIPERAIAESVSQFLSLPFRDRIDPKAVRLGALPTAFCKAKGIVPLAGEGSGASFLLSNPFNWDVQEAIQGLIGRNDSPALMIAEPAALRRLLDPEAAAAEAPPTMSELEKRLKEEYVPVVDAAVNRETNEESAPVIQLVNTLIEAAYAQGASDIHIEPAEEEVVVRYRVDGDMKIVNRFKPPRLIQPLTARIKIMAGLDISERRLPQDGRIVFKKFSKSGGDFDLRVATAPMNYGEKVVMRILDKQKSVLPLADLGFSARNMALYKEKIASPYGMVLHVGPTGSGKSMTLYAALNEIKNPALNIQTAEDPIEYTLPGINQLQTHKEIGLTFARALRSFLRLDPDVILVGEIRDKETADIAIEASLTGHLLLSTLHTNDAPSTVTRFVEMGVEPYLLSSSLLVICAQRLLRRLCSACKESFEADAVQRKLVGVPAGRPLTLHRARGCEKCNRSGYKGRIGIHEVLAPDDEFRAVVNGEDVTTERLKRLAVEKLGMTTLFWDAMEKVRQGLCSLPDALANVRQDEFDSRPRWMREELG